MDFTSTTTLTQLNTNTNTQTLLANESAKSQNNKETSKKIVVSQMQEMDKMSQMKEKYKDMFTPIPDDLHEKNIDISTVLNKYAELYSGTSVMLGKNPTKEQIHQQQIAQDKTNAWVAQQVGTLKANVLTRFFNANVYEGLESGKSVDDAIIGALESKDSFVNIQDIVKKSNSKYENQMVPQNVEISLGLFDEYKIYDSIDIRG